MTSSVPLRGRLVTSVLRPSAPPLGWGIALATGLIVVEILLVLMLKRIAPENAFGAVFLFGVLVVSAGWGFRLSIATAVASTAARSEEPTSELQSLMRISYAVFCLKKT